MQLSYFLWILMNICEQFQQKSPFLDLYSTLILVLRLCFLFSSLTLSGTEKETTGAASTHPLQPRPLHVTFDLQGSSAVEKPDVRRRSGLGFPQAAWRHNPERKEKYEGRGRSQSHGRKENFQDFGPRTTNKKNK